MKCNTTLVLLLSPLFLLSSAYAASSSGFGSIAEQLLPQIGFGYSIVTFVLGFVSLLLSAYTCNLWMISRKNGQMVPFHRVFLALCITIFCIFITIMDRPGSATSIKPIPIVKAKKYEKEGTSSEYEPTHWSNKKSTQKSN